MSFPGYTLGPPSDSALAAIPSWLYSENFPVQVADEIRKCSVFIGLSNSAGFSVFGTGFLALVEQEEHQFSYLVTAAHVVAPERRMDRNWKPSDSIVQFRLNQTDGMALCDTRQRLWFFHPDRAVDLCCFPLAFYPAPKNLDTKLINMSGTVATPERIEHFAVGLGDEVFIVSAFVGRVGDHRNIPIVRIGNLAAMAEEPIAFGSPRKPAYLIETRSLGGTSGAPVFVNLQSIRKSKRPSVDAAGVPYVLLGMVLGSHSGQYADDFVSEADTDLLVPKDADFNAGISVVLPATDILDFLESGEVKKQRDNHLEIRRSKSGFKPSSTRSARVVSASSPVAENPDHREDFMSMLSAAAKDKPPADQT